VIKLDLSNRTTDQIVVLCFTVMICLVVVITISVVLLFKILHPEIDVSRATEVINTMVSMIVGGVVGFINGRETGRKETNGKLDAGTPAGN
jgi:hypothetical protein